MAYIGVSPQNGVRKKHTYTASGSQTSFTGAGAEGITLSYKDSNFVDVYQNGVKLAEADYQSTTGTSIVLLQGAAANDIVEIIVYDVFSTSDMVSASDGGTFAGNVAMSGNLDVDGILEADAITVNGTALNTVIAGVTVANATLAATATVTDSNANTNFPIVFHDESNALLDDTGALRYNPSTGELLVPKLTVAGTTTTVDTVTMNAANAVVFEGASANDHETTLTIVDPTADRTINLPNVSGTIPVLAAASNTAITSTPAELNLLDGITAGTVSASLAVIVDSNKDITGFRNVTLTGELVAATVDATTLQIGNTSITATGNELNRLDITSLGQVEASKAVTADSSNFVNFPDNAKIRMGTGNDLEIFHDPSNGNRSVIKESGGGSLHILGTNVVVGVTGDNKTQAQFIDGGAVELYHNNSKKFETTSSGVTVTGNIANASGSLTIDSASQMILDAAGGNHQLLVDGTEYGRFFVSGGDFYIFNPTSNKDIKFYGNDDGSNFTALTLDMSDAGTAIFNHDIKIADNNNIQLGAGADLFMFSDGTDGTIDALNGTLKLRSDPDSGAASSRIQFEVDGSEGMRLISGGKLLVGNTDVGVHVCRISGNSGGNAVLKVDNSATSGNTTCYLAFMDGSGGASVNSAFFQGFNGSNNFYLLGNGTHTFTSDENAKKNIETTRDGYLEDLAKLRVVKYNWKEQEDGEDKELGLIAQEVEKVFPKLVMNDIDPQIEEKDKKKMIKTTVLPFMLLKALQEANTKITALEARITALESA